MRVLVTLKRGNGRRSHIIYATVRSEADNSLLISATLNYVLAAARERGYILIGSDGTTF
jgi:hypothetical protein